MCESSKSIKTPIKNFREMKASTTYIKRGDRQSAITGYNGYSQEKMDLTQVFHREMSSV